MGGTDGFRIAILISLVNQANTQFKQYYSIWNIYFFKLIKRFQLSHSEATLHPLILTAFSQRLSCLPLSGAGLGPRTGVNHLQYVRRLRPCTRKHDQGEVFRVPGSAEQADE